MTKEPKPMFLRGSKELKMIKMLLKDYPLPKRAIKPLCLRALEHLLGPGLTKSVDGLTESETKWVLNTAEKIKERRELAATQSNQAQPAAQTLQTDSEAVPGIPPSIPVSSGVDSSGS